VTAKRAPLLSFDHWHSAHDRYHAATREQAMAKFKAAWEN